MTASYNSPGVYSSEIDLSDISSITAITRVFQAGQTLRGPLEATFLTTSKKFREIFGNPDPKLGFGAYAAQVALDAGGTIYFKRVVGVGATFAAIQKKLDDTITTAAVAGPEAILDTNRISVYAPGPGPGYNTISVEIVKRTDDENLFNVNVYDSSVSANVIESYTVSADFYKDGMGAQTRAEEVVNVNSNRIRIKLGLATTVGTDISLAKTGFPAAAAGTVPTEANMVNAYKEAYNTRKFQISLVAAAGYTSKAFQSALDQLCQFRKDTFGFLDAPASAQASPDLMVQYRKGSEFNLNTSYCALSGQDWKYFDYNSNLYLYLPASIAALQRAIKSDAMKAPWYPIAGYNRGIIDSAFGLRYDYDRNDRDLMYPNQINSIENDPGYGYIYFGNKTLQSKLTALSYIHVRRLLCVLYPNLDAASKPSLFELQDEFLWLRVQKLLEGYLQQVKDGKGLYKFKVVCDSTNNEPADIDRGVLNVDVFLQPARDVEAIAIQYILTATGASFTEAAASI